MSMNRRPSRATDAALGPRAESRATATYLPVVDTPPVSVIGNAP
jgi:hypothetical protein